MKMKYKRIIELAKSIESDKNVGSTYLTIGWVCVITSAVLYFISMFQATNFSLGFFIGIFVFGTLALSLGYRKEKGIKDLEKKLEKVTKK